MRLEQSFKVPVPVAQAWSVLLDVERIAPCMPGATLTEFDGEKFAGVVKVKLGPINLAYRGTGRFAEKDESGHRVVIVASGQDSRGAGGASARVTAVLHSADGGAATEVKVVTDLDIAGRAAQFGRGLIGDVSGKLIKQFADCLAQTIAAEGAASAPAAAVPATAAAAAEAPPAAAPAVETEPIAASEPILAEPPGIPVFDPGPDADEQLGAPPSPHEQVGAAPAEQAPAEPPATEPFGAGEPVAAPEPAPAPAPTPAATPATVPQPRKAPVEAEPIDLLAVTGAKSVMRRAAPYLVVLLVLVVVLVVWLVAR